MTPEAFKTPKTRTRRPIGWLRTAGDMLLMGWLVTVLAVYEAIGFLLHHGDDDWADLAR